MLRRYLLRQHPASERNGKTPNDCKEKKARAETTLEPFAMKLRNKRKRALYLFVALKTSDMLISFFFFLSKDL